MASVLDQIVELQSVLDELAEAEAVLGGVPDWMQELHAEHQEHKAKIDAIEAVKEEAAAERRAAETAVADAQEKLKHLQEQIGKVRNQREYGALLQEIDTIKTEIKNEEDAAFAAMEKAEASNEPLEQERAAFKDLDERYAVELEKWEAQKPDIAKRADELRGRAEVLKEQLPPQNLSLFLRLYERLDRKALSAVNEVTRSGSGAVMWRCSSCNFNVRPQLVVSIRSSGAIVHCDSCKRILYYNEHES